jgi:hypothetical protein
VAGGGGGPSAEKQLLDPHWEKKAGEVVAWSAPRSTAWWSTAAGACATARSIRRRARALHPRGAGGRRVASGRARCPFCPPTAS